MINRALESKGIVIYTPLEQKMIDQNKPDIRGLRKNTKQFVLRVHVQHKTGTQIKIQKSNQEILLENNSIHHAIFENQLRLAPPLSHVHLDFIEW